MYKLQGRASWPAQKAPTDQRPLSLLAPDTWLPYPACGTAWSHLRDLKYALPAVRMAGLPHGDVVGLFSGGSELAVFQPASP